MIAILTGDIAGSQELTEAQRGALPSTLGEAARLAGLDDTFEVFGGDSWQALCQPTTDALTKAVLFRCYLSGQSAIDTRISIGFGSYESLQTEKISLSQGEAFVLSGRGLREMPESRRITLHPSPKIDPATGQLMQVACALLDCLSLGWTAKQSLAVALSLPASSETEVPAQKELAKRFDPPISPQAFGKHLASAQWSEVKAALQSFSSALAATLPNPEPDADRA